MGMIILPVDTAVVVPVNIYPLVDDLDFKTIETCTYNQAGLSLQWNFVTVAGATTKTSVTPTTGGGDYDWTDLGGGMMKMGIPASGGASINNATEGYGWFSGVATGILPWRGPIITFAPANVANSLVAGSDYLDVNVIQWKGTSASNNTGDAYSVLTGANTELASTPTTTATLQQMLQWLFEYFRNKRTVSTSAEILYKEDASTPLGTAALSDDGTTYTKGEHG